MFWFATFLKPNTSQAVIIVSEKAKGSAGETEHTTAAPPDMVVTADAMLGYLVSTYTRVRSWAGYGADTPYFSQRTRESEQAFLEGVMQPAWSSMHVFYVERSTKDTDWQPPQNSRVVFHNARYRVWESPATRASETTNQQPHPGE